MTTWGASGIFLTTLAYGPNQTQTSWETPSAASVLTQSLASLPPLHHIPPHAKSIPLYKALSSDGDIIEELRGDRT